MDTELPRIAVAEHLASKIAALEPARLPAAVHRKCEDLLIDVIGLCVTARHEPYVNSAIAGWDDEGSCTAIGHARPMSAAGAAFPCINPRSEESVNKAVRHSPFLRAGFLSA